MKTVKSYKKIFGSGPISSESMIPCVIKGPTQAQRDAFMKFNNAPLGPALRIEGDKGCL